MKGIRRLTGTIDDIGKKTRISITLGEIAIPSKEVDAADFQQAATAVLKYLHDSCPGELEAVEQVAVRVVHGGDHFTSAVRYDDEVKRQIQIREELAPLHNQNSLKVIEVIRRYRDSLPIAVAFDTAFHQTLPETAWRYPIDRELADKHGIRKFGFHGLSHRYMMEQYAYLEGKPTSDVTLVTMHLESGSSVAAIAQGRSVETSMGFTPLEGLMMGTRSGSIDPAILPFLMKHEHLSVDAVLDVLEKHSGMLGISGTTMDTRILRKQSDPAAKQGDGDVWLSCKAGSRSIPGSACSAGGRSLWRRYRREYAGDTKDDLRRTHRLGSQARQLTQRIHDARRCTYLGRRFQSATLGHSFG